MGIASAMGSSLQAQFRAKFTIVAIQSLKVGRGLPSPVIG